MSTTIKPNGHPDPTGIRGWLTPWSCNGLLFKHTAKILKKLRKVWPKYSMNLSDAIILESIGTWGNHLNWSDEYGYYIQIRMDPLTSRLKVHREAAREIVNAYKSMFPGAKFEEENLDILDIECTDWRDKDERLNGTITIVAKIGSYSIGD